MSKQTKKGNKATSYQNGKNVKKVVSTTIENEIINDVETMVTEPIDLDTEQTIDVAVINFEAAELPVVEDATELQPQTAVVEETLTDAEPSIEQEGIETIEDQVVVALQADDVLIPIVVSEATEMPKGEVATDIEHEIAPNEQSVVYGEIVEPSAAITEAIQTIDSPANDTETTELANGEPNQEIDTTNIDEKELASINGAQTPPIKKHAPKPPVFKAMQSPKKVKDDAKEDITKDKKVTLAGSGYHYYRNWLRDWLRSHGVPSARFTKSPENYNGNIIVLESEKEKGVIALEQWVTENPDIKEMFWAVNK